MTESISMRAAKNKEERMVAALRSNNEDLFESNGRLIVWGKNNEGDNIYLGDICISALYQKNINPLTLIDKVRFTC